MTMNLGSKGAKRGLAATILAAVALTVTTVWQIPDKPVNVIYRSDKTTIAVISGHGGIKGGVYQTNGKQSPTWADSTKIYEGEICKRLALMLTLELMDLGYEVTYVNSLQSDMSLSERVQRVNDINPDLAIFLHLNAQDARNGDYTDFEGVKGFTSVAAGGATGSESFTSVGWTESDEFNEKYFIPEFKAEFPDTKWRRGKGQEGKEANFYVLRYTSCPAVLAEWNFMTTYTPDAKTIMDRACQQRYVDVWVRSINKYNEDRYTK